MFLLTDVAVAPTIIDGEILPYVLLGVAVVAIAAILIFVAVKRKNKKD